MMLNAAQMMRSDPTVGVGPPPEVLSWLGENLCKLSAPRRGRKATAPASDLMVWRSYYRESNLKKAVIQDFVVAYQVDERTAKRLLAQPRRAVK